MVLSKIFFSECDSRFLYRRVKIKTAYPLISGRLLTPRVLLNTIANLFYLTCSEFCSLEEVYVRACVHVCAHVRMHVCVGHSVTSVSMPA